jgi:hypothetical protein
MPASAPAFLLAPPLPPVRLEGAREAVLGRGEECDVRVDSGQASRRHAAVRPAAGEYLVRDLGSTNGTFVNGERVAGERLLQPGDRILVGDVSVTFCRMEPAAAARGTATAAGDRTMLFEATAPSAALGGRLEEIPSYAVLQMLEMGGKSGLLTFEGDQGTVRIWLVDGRPVHAETEKTRGEEAAFAGLRLQHGSFRFEAGPSAPETTLAASLTELLLEAARQRDEEARQA